MDNVENKSGTPIDAGHIITSGAEPRLYGFLLEVQRLLKVEKSQFNTFGGYKYRSKEDILEAAKPLCHERGLLLTCDDAVEEIGGWHYIVATATVIDSGTGASVRAHGYAREPEDKKGMDASQITGTAASYAGKRALSNLFAIDDTKDSDAIPQGAPRPKEPPAQGPFTAHCECCGMRYQFAGADQYRAFVPTAQCCPTPRWAVE